MRYRVHLYNHELPIDMQADPVIVDSSGPPDFRSDPEFVVFTRDGVIVAMFRREHVQAIYEASTAAASRG